MTLSSHRLCVLLVCANLFLLSGCDDENPTSPGPGNSGWEEVDLGTPVPNSALLSVDFGGGRGLALGMTPSFTTDKSAASEALLYEMKPDGSWEILDSSGLPEADYYTDLALDQAGKAIYAGIEVPGVTPNGLIYDLRPAEPALVSHPGGMVVVDGVGSFFVAGGLSRGGELWTSLSPGIWTVDSLPLTGTNDSGLWDVDVRRNMAVACGFDDGADTLRVILKRSTSSNWTKVDLAGSNSFAVSFKCIALSESQSIFVGGILGAGGLSPKAYITVRSAAGDWAELVLPDPEALGGVNDILIAADGSIYLACSGESSDTMATILHASASGVQRELTPFPGQLLQLGESADGDIYAVGLRRGEGGGSDRGIMLKRSSN